MDRPPDAPTVGDRLPLAYRDERFLESEGGRPLRILSEYLLPLGVFRRRKVHDTIVFFGSARIRESGPLSEYYGAARELARLVTEWSAALPSPAHRYLVCSGGGPGIMEAANRGAHDVGAKSIGLNITLPMEQVPNPYITPSLCFQFHYFALRKMHFLMRAKALVVFPGGFGTLDELFNALTLRQTQRMQEIPIILFGREYWSRVIDFQFLANEGVIADAHLDLISYAETPEEAWNIIARFHHE